MLCNKFKGSTPLACPCGGDDVAEGVPVDELEDDAGDDDDMDAAAAAAAVTARPLAAAFACAFVSAVVASLGSGGNGLDSDRFFRPAEDVVDAVVVVEVNVEVDDIPVPVPVDDDDDVPEETPPPFLKNEDPPTAVGAA